MEKENRIEFTIYDQDGDNVLKNKITVVCSVFISAKRHRFAFKTDNIPDKEKLLRIIGRKINKKLELLQLNNISDN